VGFPPAGAPVEGDAAVLRAPGPRAAPALPRRRPGPRISRRRSDRVALLHYLLLMLPHRRRRYHRLRRREELLGDGGCPGDWPGYHREAEDHSRAFPGLATLHLLLASNGVVDAVEGSLGGRHCRRQSVQYVHGHEHTLTHGGVLGFVASKFYVMECIIGAFPFYGATDVIGNSG
jgi:hypothetical protein